MAVLDLVLLGVVADMAVMLRAVAYLHGCCLGCSKAKLDVNPLLYALDADRSLASVAALLLDVVKSLASVTARLLDDIRDDGHEGEDEGCLGILSNMLTFM